MLEIVNIADREKNPSGSLELLELLDNRFICDTRLVQFCRLEYKNPLQHGIQGRIHNGYPRVRIILKNHFPCIHRRLERTTELRCNAYADDSLSRLDNRRKYINIILYRRHR